MIDFDWDDDNLTHIAEHHVSRAEAEFALNGFTLELGQQDWHEEERFEEAGITQHGRILLVITTWRGMRLRVVTAYDAPRHVVKEYLESRG